jgi:hypothetical protein
MAPHRGSWVRLIDIFCGSVLGMSRRGKLSLIIIPVRFASFVPRFPCDGVRFHFLATPSGAIDGNNDDRISDSQS